MRRYLLDTNHAGELLKKNPRMRTRVRPDSGLELGVARPTVGELWYMVLNSARIRENQLGLDELLGEMKIWELDDPACFEFGTIRVELRKRGTPLPQIDVQIAAIARVNDLTVLSADRHFNMVQGLRVENWL